MVNKVYQTLLLAKERLKKDKLKRTLDDIDELCKKCLWLCWVEGI